MTTSNTKDCFREFLGKTVKGVLFNALPWNRTDLAKGTKTLIFDDGRGLTIASNGSFWVDDAEEVRRAINERTIELRKTQEEISEVLSAAGGHPPEAV